MNVKKTVYFNINNIIKWCFDNNIQNGKYWSNNGSYILFENYSISKVYLINKEDLFKVEIEKEITLDTKIESFLEKDYYNNYRTHYNKSINELLFLNTTSNIWVINEDDTHTLIYKNGKLSNDYGRFE